MKTVDKAFRRMGELAMLARDETKSTQDRALYDQEFQQLKDYVIDSTKKEFNSVPLFDGTDIAVTIDSEGDTFDMTGIDMTAVSYTNGLTRTDPSVSGVSSDPGSAYAAFIADPDGAGGLVDEAFEHLGGDAWRAAHPDDEQFAGGDQPVEGGARHAEDVGCLADPVEQSFAHVRAFGSRLHLFAAER